MVCREHNDNAFPEHLLTHVLRPFYVWSHLMFTTVYEVCFHFIHEKSLSERSSLTWNRWSKDLNWCWSGCYFLILRLIDRKYFRFYWCTSIALTSQNEAIILLSVFSQSFWWWFHLVPLTNILAHLLINRKQISGSKPSTNNRLQIKLNHNLILILSIYSKWYWFSISHLSCKVSFLNKIKKYLKK